MLEVSFSAIRADPPAPGSQIAFKYDDTAFSSSTPVLSVESRCDDKTWLVVPTSTEREITRELIVETDISAPTGEAINLNLAMPVVIRPNRRRRFSFLADFFSAAGLVMGTAGVALFGKPVFASLASIVLIVAGYLLYLFLALASRVLKP